MAKRIISLLLCLALVLSFGAMTSCGGDDLDDGSGEGFMPEDLNVTVWGAFGEDYWEAWSRDYPTINLDRSTSSDFSLATLAAAISAGTQPDMFYTNNAAAAPLGEAVAKKLVMPLDDYLPVDPATGAPADASLCKDQSYTWDDLPSWYSMFMTFPDENGDQHVYGVYTDVSVGALVWNKDLFEANGYDRNTPPATWSEMYDMAKAMTKTDASGLVTQAGFLDYTWWFEHWRLTYGDSYQDRYTGKVTVNDNKFTAVMNYLLKFPEIFGGSEKVAEGVSFESGNVAMGIADIGYGQKLAQDFEVGIAAMPYDDSPEYGLTETTVSGYAWQWYGIPTGAKNPDGGWLFSRWAVTNGSASVQERDAIANPETWNPVYLVNKNTRQELYDKYLDGCREDVKNNLMQRDELFDQITLDQPVNAPINADFVKALESDCVAIMNGTFTVTEGLEDAQKQGDALYNRYMKDVS